MLMPSTYTRSLDRSTRMILPVLPLSLPEITMTSSSVRSFISEHLRGERDDLHEPAVAQLAGHRPEDARAARVVLGVDDHGRVLVEGDVGPVVAPELLLRAHDDGLDDLALLDRPLRRGLLDRGGDDVPHARVAAARAAHHADAEDLAGAGVVGDLQARLVLDHFARSSTSVRRQRFERLMGRHSTTRTVSPSLALFASSCAYSLSVERRILWYRRWRRTTSILTVIVLSPFADVTTPWRTRGRPGPCSGACWGSTAGMSFCCAPRRSLSLAR